jgi:hypothetical protein
LISTYFNTKNKAIDPTIWGAHLAGSPVMAFTDKQSHVSVLLIPVGGLASPDSVKLIGD